MLNAMAGITTDAIRIRLKCDFITAIQRQWYSGTFGVRHASDTILCVALVLEALIRCINNQHRDN